MTPTLDYKAKYERLIEGLTRLAQAWEAREPDNPYAKSLRETVEEAKAERVTRGN